MSYVSNTYENKIFCFPWKQNLCAYKQKDMVSNITYNNRDLYTEYDMYFCLVQFY